MTIKNLQSYQNSSSPEKLDILKKQTEKYFEIISEIEKSFKAENITEDKIKALTCELLAKAFAGQLKKERYTEAETIALKFTASTGYNEFLDYDDQASFFAPRLATCLYFLDCVQNPVSLNYLKQLNCVPQDFQENDPFIQRAIDLLGLAVIFNTMDRPFYQLEFIVGLGSGIAFWGAIALTITTIVAAMGALAIAIPFFAIPAFVCAAICIASAIAYPKVSRNIENDIQNYENAVKTEWNKQTDDFSWATFFKNNGANLPSNNVGPTFNNQSSNQLFSAISQIVSDTQQSEQFNHFELRK